MRVFSGVQPTGNLHLGNYLGAIKQFAELQTMRCEAFYCVVDLHAITVKHDPALLKKHTREIAAAYIGAGIDPKRSTIFVQSHVPAHAELQWLLSNVARMGWLERMTQYREKTNSVPPKNLREILGRVRSGLVMSNPRFPDPYPIVNAHDQFGRDIQVEQTTAFQYNDILAMYDMLSRVTSNSEGASVGLFTYPILMAADILAYKATHVPVGDDQMQHLNLARDIAEKFNHDYDSIFPIPEPLRVKEGARVMSLKDGLRKMSKSDENDASRINLADSDDVIAKKIKKATADTHPFPHGDEYPVPSEVANLINIYVACSGEPREAVFKRFGGQGYGTFKPALADAVIATVAPVRDAMNRLLAVPDHLDAVLLDGADRANEEASDTVTQVRDEMGFL